MTSKLDKINLVDSSWWECVKSHWHCQSLAGISHYSILCPHVSARVDWQSNFDSDDTLQTGFTSDQTGLSPLRFIHPLTLVFDRNCHFNFGKGCWSVCLFVCLFVPSFVCLFVQSFDFFCRFFFLEEISLYFPRCFSLYKL